MRRETQPETSGPCPLDGVRVLELGGIGPVPFCGLLLTQLGADVVRVDRPGGVPSPLTSLAGFAEADPLAAGRRSVEVDLKSSSGVQTVVALASRADILIEGWRPGVAERLGVGPAACHDANPALVYGRMTGWGQSGPLSASAGHDINYVALTGLLSAIGPADGGPVVPLNLLGDFGGGAMYLAVGVLAALHRARRTGRGDVVDAAIVDGVSHLSTMVHGLAAAGFWQEGRGRNVVDGSLPYYTVYETADGKHMAVGALEQRFFEEMCRVLEIEVPPNREDPQMHSELRERLARRFRERSQAEWERLFSGVDACVSPVRSLVEARRDSHLRARGVFAQPGAAVPAAAPRFSCSMAQPVAAPPRPGQHQTEVFQEWGVAVPEAGRGAAEHSGGKG